MIATTTPKSANAPHHEIVITAAATAAVVAVAVAVATAAVTSAATVIVTIRKTTLQVTAIAIKVATKIRVQGVVVVGSKALARVVLSEISQLIPAFPKLAV
jgi:hypothetical protein